ncbi:fungal-specific transcription factor domain-containing protein [Xylogone sp. PMI_703]|nr:fungal-specific transcription factor domain-containing protein [Xylogone sp. PMI_703]
MASTGSGTSSPALPPLARQIRFVNNEGRPPAKRRRISAACRTCRKRKTRCDGKRPFCSTCTDNGHQCLGYAAVGEGKKDSKAPGNLADEDYVKDEDDYDKVSTGSLPSGQQSFGNTSPVLHREGSTSYPDGKMAIRQREADLRDLKTEQERRSGRDFRDAPTFSDEDQSPMSIRTPGIQERHNILADSTRPATAENRQTESRKVPYFRYFGPTAIVPGFKQMVVSVREHRRSTGAASSISSASGGYGGLGTPQPGVEQRPVEMPVYDPNDGMPVQRLTIHLVETFFTHLGCNYPFLKPDKFIRMVQEKRVEPILVDAVCALAARFSDHPMLTANHNPNYPKWEYGHIFAQRAKAAVVDTFPCPTVAAVQACLLLAYEGFGSNQDSALWMYLGCAIRMAVDLGLQKLDGVKHQGEKDPGHHRHSIDASDAYSQNSNDGSSISQEEKREIEQERINTLWAVFMLDRVISSGTGRPVTLRDEDFELGFPAITANAESGWPDPFPALIQIIHLYGRVSDLLNNIRNVRDVTPERMSGLAEMEMDLTQLYQRLDQRLTFNATNFQHYVKSGEGTNFILVHFWFHTLIMLLHQPTLMHSFEGQILQLLPNSRELSMSSAKTIADILAFAELIDPKSFIGNPFTSQPMYIAACAFLMESAAHSNSQPTSRERSPPRSGARNGPAREQSDTVKGYTAEQKHSLLASAANQNYQRCYKSLQQLETYWAGTRYILVALDQKAKGIWDPETYTVEDMESTKVGKSDMVPHWKMLAMTAPSPGRFSDMVRSPMPMLDYLPGSPGLDASQAIGWSINGTTNSASSNITLMFQNSSGEQHQQQQQQQPPPRPPSVTGNMVYDPIRQSLPAPSPEGNSPNYNTKYTTYPQPRPSSGSMLPPTQKYNALSPSGPASTSEAEMLLGIQNQQYSQTPNSHHSYDQSAGSPSNVRHDPQSTNSFEFSQSQNFHLGQNAYMGMAGVGDMKLESQEIDMASLVSGDMMPFLEYLPQDVWGFYDNGNGMSSSSGMNGNVGMQNMRRNE